MTCCVKYGEMRFWDIKKELVSHGSVRFRAKSISSCPFGKGRCYVFSSRLYCTVVKNRGSPRSRGLDIRSSKKTHRLPARVKRIGDPVSNLRFFASLQFICVLASFLF